MPGSSNKVVVQGHLQAPETRTSTSLVTVTIDTRASRTMLKSILKVARNGKCALKSLNLLGGHVNFWGFEADFVLGHFEKFTFGYTFFDILKNQRQPRSFCS
jgi:hypothetical protein